MSKTLYAALAAVTTLACLPAAADAAVAYNSAPAAGWHYGTGNDYTPANTEVLTTIAGDELDLRWHVRGELAPASVGDTYFFPILAAGTKLNFDWGYDFNSGARNSTATALITVKNIGTGQSVSYDPAIFQPDSATFTGNVQNSANLSFAFLSGVGFNPTVDGLYSVTLDVNGMSGGTQSLTAFAQIGAGVPEPATWALMIGGFGLVGGAMRRRARTSVTFA